MCKYCDKYEGLADKVQAFTEQGWRNRDIAAKLGVDNVQTIIQVKARHHIRRLRTPGGGYSVGLLQPVIGARCRSCGADKSLPCPVPRCSRYQGEDLPTERTLAGVSAGW